MAYRDMNGNITINENAANADIKRLCAAKQYLVDSENAINSLIKQAADAFIENGLKDAGYEYVVIDDCWSEKQRNEKGELVPDH